VAARRILIVLDVSAGRATVHVRGWRFAESFRTHGWNVEFVDTTEVSEADILKKAKAAEVTYLIKIRSLELVRRLRSQGSKVIFDLTDPLWELRYRRGGWWNIDEILMLSDAVFSENEFVCAYGRKYNDRVFSIPVCTQVERFDELRETAAPPPSDRVVIGWVGSSMTVSAIFHIAPALEEVARRHPEVEIRLLGTETKALPEWKHARVTLVPKYDEERMIREILAMHIGIYPPPEDLDDYRIRGAHKALLYMTGGVPPVAQNAGDCVNKIRDGVTGMLASTEQEWIEKLSVLVRSPELRREMGERAAVAVRAEHTLENVFLELEKALEAVIAAPPRPAPTLYDRTRARLPLAKARVEHFIERARNRVRRDVRRLLQR